MLSRVAFYDRNRVCAGGFAVATYRWWWWTIWPPFSYRRRGRREHKDTIQSIDMVLVCAWEPISSCGRLVGWLDGWKIHEISILRFVCLALLLAPPTPPPPSPALRLVDQHHEVHHHRPRVPIEHEMFIIFGLVLLLFLIGFQSSSQVYLRMNLLRDFIHQRNESRNDFPRNKNKTLKKLFFILRP